MKVLHLIILSELNTWTEVFQNRTKLLHFVVIHEVTRDLRLLCIALTSYCLYFSHYVCLRKFVGAESL